MTVIAEERSLAFVPVSFDRSILKVRTADIELEFNDIAMRGNWLAWFLLRSFLVEIWKPIFTYAPVVIPWRDRLPT